MSIPRIHILALGGTIATRPDATGAMQMGLGADDLVAAVPRARRRSPTSPPRRCRGSAAIRSPSTRSTRWRRRSGRSTVDGVVVTQGTDTLEETGFLLDLLVDRDIPVIVTAAMRNPALTSPDGPGNLLAAVRVACDPWVRRHAKALGVMAVMLDEVYAAADVLKVHPTRLNAFASPQTGPLAALVEDRVVPLSPAGARRRSKRRASGWAQRRSGRDAAGGAPVDGARRARLHSRGADRSLATSSAIAASCWARWAAVMCPNASRRSSGQLGRDHPDRRVAARRRRAAAAPDLWRAQLGDRAAQGRPDLGRTAQPAEGARAARDLPARRARPRRRSPRSSTAGASRAISRGALLRRGEAVHAHVPLQGDDRALDRLQQR